MGAASILIARTIPREHANGAPGEWHAEYRVRPLTDSERARIPWPVEERIRGAAWALETRYVCEAEATGGCDSHDDERTLAWHLWDYGRDAASAALSCAGDSQYSEAESLDPLHHAVKAEVVRRRAVAARVAELRAVLYATWQDKHGGYHTEKIDATRDERERAQGEYESALRKARLWKAVCENAAPEAKLAPIRERVQAEYRKRLARRLAEQEAARAELESLRAAGEVVGSLD